MVQRSGRYQASVQRQGQRSGHGGHNYGRGNGDRGNNPCNHRVRLFQQGGSDKTHVPGIFGTNTDA